MLNVLLANSGRQTFLQSTARKLLLAGCSILAIGVIGAVAIRGGDQTNTVAVVREEASPAFPAAAAVSKTTVDLAPITLETKAELSTKVKGGVELIHATAKPTATQSNRTIKMLVTAYCPCIKCCGSAAQGITASGKSIAYQGGRFVAADRSLPFGTRLVVPGYNSGKTVEVTDRGGAIKGNHIDVFFASHQQALAWGRKSLDVVVVD